jgi:hypothetical protein
MTIKTTSKTLCVVGTKGALSPWTMECIDDADAVRGLALDFVIWVRTPTPQEYATVSAALYSSEQGDHFWACRRPR